MASPINIKTPGETIVRGDTVNKTLIKRPSAATFWPSRCHLSVVIMSKDFVDCSPSKKLSHWHIRNPRPRRFNFLFILEHFSMASNLIRSGVFSIKQEGENDKEGVTAGYVGRWNTTKTHTKKMIWKRTSCNINIDEMKSGTLSNVLSVDEASASK